MKGPLTKSTYRQDRGVLKDRSNEAQQSIINSVTNDEDDCFKFKRNSGHSIVRSVTNDEDEWSEPTDSERQVFPPVQHYPRSYPSTFSEHKTATTRFEQTKSAIPPKHSLPSIERKPFEKSLFDKESFLNRYEHMMMEQEKEQLSTISHLQFFFELLLELQEVDAVYRSQLLSESEGSLLTEFSIQDLKKAQKKLKDSEKYDFVKTDKQFLMVLDILCQDKFNTADTNCLEGDRKISWVEIIQCYRNCVAGMQTLEKIGSHGTIRNRAKERTITLLSGYRESSFMDCTFNMAESSRTNEVDPNEQALDDLSMINAFGIDLGNNRKTERRRALNHPLVSFFIGAVVATLLLFGFSSNSHPMAESKNSLSERPIGADESLHSTEKKFEVFDSEEKSLDESKDTLRDLAGIGHIGGGSNILMKKSFVETNGLVAPSLAKPKSAPRLNPDSLKLTVLDRRLVAREEQNETTRTRNPLSLEMKVANIFGGTATVLYFLSTSTAPITPVAGLGVTLAVLAGRGVRDWIVQHWITKIWKTIKPNGRKRNGVSR